jgi:hypothetical protein
VDGRTGGEASGAGAAAALTTDVAVRQRWPRWVLSGWATSDLVIAPDRLELVARGWVGSHCFPRLVVPRGGVTRVRLGDDGDLAGEVEVVAAGEPCFGEVRSVRVRNAHAAREALEACGYPLELGRSWEHAPPPRR